jgi:hypothetical protein
MPLPHPPVGTATLPHHPPAALLEQLHELRRVAEYREGEREAAKASWLAALDALFAQLQAWLEPACRLGLARAEVVPFHVADDEVGAYDAPALSVTMPGPRHVWVRPVGTLVVGGRGVVEMGCGHNRGLLVLNRSGVWKLRAESAATDIRNRASSLLVVLDENEFARALMQLIL